VMEQALEQARVGRLHILKRMAEETAEALRDQVVHAFSQRASWRVRGLAMGVFREEFYNLYMQGPAEAGELTLHERSATLPLGKTTLTLVKHHRGWRVAGVAQ